MRLIVGNTISAVFIVVAIVLAFEAQHIDNPYRFVLLLISWFAMLYFSHCLTHYIVGRILGVEFSHYFLSKSMLAKAGIPVVSRLFSVKVFLTLKIKRRAGKKAMFAMFLSGALASMFTPLVVVYIAFGFDKQLATILLLLSLFNICFTGYFSYKHGCIRKALNSLM